MHNSIEKKASALKEQADPCTDPFKIIIKWCLQFNWCDANLGGNN